MDSYTKLSVPKYEHIKSNFEIFETRIRLMNERNYLLTSPGYTNLKYFKRMKDLRNRVLKLIKSHKLYNEMDFQARNKSDPIYGELSSEVLQALAKLSKPRSKDLKSTLIKINQIIRDIKNDSYFYKNPHKLKRYNELLEYRKNICCLIARDLKSEAIQCYQFAPCTKKIINVWEIPRNDKPNSRFLKFEYDKNTTNLAYPHYKFLQYSKTYYAYVQSKNIEQLKNSKTTIDKKSLIDSIEQATEKITKLQKLEEEMTLRGIINKNNISKSDEENKADKKFFTKFSNSTDLPTRKRLEAALKFYQSLLDKFQKGNNFEKEVVYESSKRIESFIQRIRRNISFTEKLLESIPQHKPHCTFDNHIRENDKKKSINITYDMDRRVNQYFFDEKTNQMAYPKLYILQDALKSQQYVLEKFENDLKNIGKFNNSEHENIQKRINFLNDLLSKKREIIDYQRNNQHQPGVPTSFYHFKTCLEDKMPIFRPKEYKGLKARVKISTSTPHRKFVLDSFNTYVKWIEERKRDIQFKNQIEFVLQNASMTDEIDKPTEEDEEASIKLQFDNIQVSCHTQKMIENMFKLEKFLETLKPVHDEDTDVHLQTHQKLDKAKEMKITKRQKIDIKRMNALALPKQLLVKYCLLHYANRMSENKRRRIKCRYSKSILKPEQLEHKLISKMTKRVKHSLRSRTNEHAHTKKIFERIIENGIDEMLRYTVFHALMLQ